MSGLALEKNHFRLKSHSHSMIYLLRTSITTNSFWIPKIYLKEEFGLEAGLKLPFLSRLNIFFNTYTYCQSIYLDLDPIEAYVTNYVRKLEKDANWAAHALKDIFPDIVGFLRTNMQQWIIGGKGWFWIGWLETLNFLRCKSKERRKSFELSFGFWVFDQ